MAFREMGGGGGTILKWDTPGTVVEGRLLGTKRGKEFSGRPTTLATIAKPDGVQVTVSLTTALENRFIEHEIKPGAVLRLTYKGLATGKTGRQYKDFKLEIDVPDEPKAPTTGGSDDAAVELALQQKIGKQPADAIVGTLKQLYGGEGKDPSVYAEKLRETAKLQGVSA